MAACAQLWTDWSSLFTQEEDSADVSLSPYNCVCMQRKFWHFFGISAKLVIYIYKISDA